MYSKEQVRVSIIVPTYNHEKYIAQTIESILKQKTSYGYEILIGDDCSTDNTRRIIDEYKEQYPDIIRVFYHKKNVGATKNGYTLFKHSKGEYLAFCDGDDYWDDEYRLQRDIEFLEANFQYTGVSGKVCPVDEDCIPLDEATISKTKQFWNFSYDEFTLKDFENWEMPGHVSALTIRNFMKNSEHDYRIFYQAHDMVGDRTIVLLAVLSGNIICNSNIVSCYRYRDNGKENFMSSFKAQNLYAQDYLMVRRLEHYSKKEFGIVVSADKVKKDRLVASVVRAMKSKSVGDIRVVTEILRYSGRPLLYLYYIAKIVILKNVYWHFCKDDRRVNL